MNLTEEIGSLAELQEVMQKPSLEVIEAIGRRMPEVEKGDKTLGVIHSEAIKRLHLARKEFHNRIHECRHKCDLALDEIEVERLSVEGIKADALEDLATQMMVTEIRILFGAVNGDIVLRRGWMAVVPKQSGSQQFDIGDVLKQIFNR